MATGLRVTEGLAVAAMTILLSGVVGYFSGRIGVERELARQGETTVSLRRDLDRASSDLATRSSDLALLARELDRIEGQIKAVVQARASTDEQVAGLSQADEALSARLAKLTEVVDDMTARLSLLPDRAIAMTPAQQACVDLMMKVQNPPGAMVVWRSDGTSSLDDASRGYLRQFQELGCGALLAGGRP